MPSPVPVSPIPVPASSAPAEPHLPWKVVGLVFLLLLIFWIAIWVLDFHYYNRLLLGAVDSLLALEEAINSEKPIEFNMSHKIQQAVLGENPRHRREATYEGPRLFYLIVAGVLVVATVYSIARATGWQEW